MEFPRDFGPYHLLKQIAMGGMAEIVLAKTTGSFGFEKLLALKMIHPKFSQDKHFIDMLIEEAKICVELDHVNIGQVFDLGKLKNTYFIAMEFVEGADVFKLMRRATEIGYEVPIESCAHIGQEICIGLEYAHTKRDSEGRPLGIIHRDMSPQNVMISNAGEVKIVDFGIAKAGVRAKQTEVGVIKGKYYYMSPEQAWGDSIDHRSDIFSAGIIIYEMLTSQMLYLEENIDVLLDRVRKADIAPPSSMRREIPSELDDILMKALSKQPEDRYQTAHEMGQALSSFLYNFSPDYTSARLASMMAWLFDEEAHREQQAAAQQKQEQDDSLLLTRNDFSKSPPKASGSLLFEFSDLVELIEQSDDDPTADSTDQDPTSQVLLPEMMQDFAENYGNEQDVTEPTSAFSLPYEGHSLPLDALDDWGDGDEPTFIETTEDMLKRFKADLSKPDTSENERQPSDVTQKIDMAMFESKVAQPERSPKDSSYVPPPPPPPAPPPSPSSMPSKPPPLSKPSPSAPGSLPSRQTKRSPSKLPPKAPRPLKSAPPPPPPLPPPPPPPLPLRPAAPPPKRQTLGQPNSSKSSAPLVKPRSLSGGTGQTAMIPPGLQLDPKSHEDTGPTDLTPIANNHPLVLGSTGEQTNPSLKHDAPFEDYEPAESEHNTRKIDLNLPPQAHQSSESMQPSEPIHPSPQQSSAAPETPPWLISDDVQLGSPAAQPNGDLFRNDLLMAPPDAEDIAALRQASVLKRLRKVALPLGIALILIIAVVIFWPRPDPVSTLDIRSHPPGAQVFLNGQRIPRLTPTTIEELALGSVHQVELRLVGFTPWAQAVQLNAEEVRQIAVLSPIRGTLRVTSEPSGASVIIDGVYRGQTPHVIEGLDINRDVAIQVRYEERTQTQTLVWGGRTEATSHFTFESRQRRRR